MNLGSLIRSTVMLLIIGSAVVFAGVQVSEYAAVTNIEKENEQVYETLQLLSILSLLGVATFLIIKMLNIIFEQNLTLKMVSNSI